MDRTDEELVAAYRGGEREAFDTLAQRHLSGVYSFVLRFVGDAQEAQDVVQETVTKAWRALSQYDSGKSSFKTWLLRIARNAAIDHLRKRRHVPFSELEGEHENVLAETLPDAEALPDELLNRAQDARLLNEALLELSPKHREVLLLYYTNELTLEEISRMLDEPHNTTKSRHRRALLALRDALEGRALGAPIRS